MSRITVTPLKIHLDGNSNLEIAKDVSNNIVFKDVNTEQRKLNILAARTEKFILLGNIDAISGILPFKFDGARFLDLQGKAVGWEIVQTVGTSGNMVYKLYVNNVLTDTMTLAYNITSDTKALDFAINSGDKVEVEIYSAGVGISDVYALFYWY